MEAVDALKECFEKKLLRKTFASNFKAKKSIKQAEFFLEEAFEMIDLGKKEMASLALYNSAFHTARAILFVDGVKEKSHYCLQKYLENKAKETTIVLLEDAELFDTLRGIRQGVQYELEKFNFEENLDSLYNKTQNFLGRVKKWIESLTPT